MMRMRANMMLRINESFRFRYNCLLVGDGTRSHLPHSEVSLKLDQQLVQGFS